MYAGAGISDYWVLDLPAGVAACYVLDAATYRLVTEGPVVDTTRPVSVRIDIATLTDPV